MPPPKDLPGFYFDPEKNRYFPIKGPIPGSKRPPPSTSNRDESSDRDKKHQRSKGGRREGLKPLELIRLRELLGTSIISKRRRYHFKNEYEKLQTSRPQVLEYQRTACAADSALEHINGILQTAEGLKQTYIVSAGSTSGSLSLFEVGRVTQCFSSGTVHMPLPVWPDEKRCLSRNDASCGMWSSSEASTSFSSGISSIRRIGRHSPDQACDVSPFQRALVTTLGSGISGGSVYIVNLTKPLDLTASSLQLHRRTLRVDSFDCTIWSADCHWDGTHAVIGTNFGAALIDLETRASSWVYRTKSDVFSQQFDSSGNVVLCGLRNGGIVEVDVREKQSSTSEVSSVFSRTASVQRVNQASRGWLDKRSGRKFETKSTSTSSGQPIMSSSVCSLVGLRSDDQYFIASSMDGSIKLFDRRFLHRGAVQSYEGHINSHSQLHLGVNPSETLVLSGGEDRVVRTWSIKSGELLFEENVSNSVIATVCWPRGIHGLLRPVRYCEDRLTEPNYSWGAWLGSREGLFFMHGA